MYNYAEQKQVIFTDEGQRMLLKIRDKMNFHCAESGAVDFLRATLGLGVDSWAMLACIDRLCEIGEFECIWDRGITQHRIYKRRL